MIDVDKVLTLNDVARILSDNEKVEPSPKMLKEVEACHCFLVDFASDKVIYGINTGFGPMAQYRIEESDLKNLQYNIIRSHATGAGEALPVDCVRLR